MNRSYRVTLGFAGLAAVAVAGLSGCSTAEDEKAAKPAAGTTTTEASSSTVTPAASTPSTTSSTPASTTTTTSSVTATTSTAASDTTGTGSPMVGGMTECTKAALAEPASAAAQALGPKNLYTIDQLNCADGWAVTSGLLSSTDNPEMGAPTSFVFQQEGQFWVVQDKAKICGTNPTTTTAPADAAIPAALFLPGCAAG